MSNYKVEISGVDTRNLKVLSNEEMLELFKNIKTNPFARNDLVEGNLKLVLSILKKFKNYNENLDDLFQVGCVGLVKSIDNFDLSQNVKFSTYAVPMIIGEIRRYLRDNNTIRVSRSIKDLAYKALKYKEEYILTNGKEPSCEEISQKLECTTYDVVTALASLRNPISMFEPIYSDGGDTIYLYDQIEDKKQKGSEMEKRLATNDAITMLPERCQHILEERFIIGKTQMEVAEELAISQAQVSRLEKTAVKQLKKILK